MNQYQNLNKRQRNILDLLRNRDFVTIDELADFENVSQPTIRRDLKLLSSLKYIERFYGGARINKSRTIEILNLQKYSTNWSEKLLIGKKAVDYVEDGDLIALNTGTTIMAFSQNLSRKKNLTIIVGDYEIARMLSQRNDFNVIIPGGEVEKEVPGLVGKFSVEMIEKFVFNKTFMGVKGLNPVEGLMTSRYDQAVTAQAFIKSSRKFIVLADSSKFTKRTGAIIAPFSSIDVLITDKGLLNYPEIHEQILAIPSIELILV